MAQTYYEVLGVAENATRAEIEAAFKSKAREVHPDKVPPGNTYLRKIAAEAFKDLSEAKTVLLDPSERRKYDSELAYMRGAETFYTAPQPSAAPSSPPPPPPRPQQSPSSRAAGSSQQGKNYSFWKPINTKFAIAAVASIVLGCFVSLIGMASSEQAASLGIALIASGLGLLCWRHGGRPTTDAAYLGGSVFLFLFAIIFFYAGLQSSPTKLRSPTLTSTAVTKVPPQPSRLTLSPLNTTTRPPQRTSLEALPEFIPDEDSKHQTDPILTATRGTSKNKQPPVANQPDGNPLRTENPRERAFGPALKAMYRGSPRYSCPIGSQVELASDNSAWCVSDALASGVARTELSTRRTGIGSEPTVDSRPMPPTQSSTHNVTALKDLNTGKIIFDNAPPITVSKPAEPLTYLGATHSAPATRGAGRPDLPSLSGPERTSIEAACSIDKYNNGPAAYNRCLQNQLNLLSGAPGRPDLSSLSGPERTSIEAACSIDKYNNGPAAYNRCLQSQLNLLSAAPRRPDLSSLSGPELTSIEAACSIDKYNNGPAAYNRCLARQLAILNRDR